MEIKEKQTSFQNIPPPISPALEPGRAVPGTIPVPGGILNAVPE